MQYHEVNFIVKALSLVGSNDTLVATNDILSLKANFTFASFLFASEKEKTLMTLLPPKA